MYVLLYYTIIPAYRARSPPVKEEETEGACGSHSLNSNPIPKRANPDWITRLSMLHFFSFFLFFFQVTQNSHFSLSLSLCVCVCLLFFCLFVRVWGVCDDVLESVPQSVSRSIEKEKNSHIKNQHNSFSLVPHKLFCRAEKKKNKKKASEKRRIGNTWHAHSVVN